MKRTPLRRVSKKRARESKTYSVLRKAFLARQIFCTAGINGCYRKATEVHHTKGRGRFYLDVTTFKAVCRPCHDWIESNKREARKLGLITYK